MRSSGVARELPETIGWPPRIVATVLVAVSLMVPATIGGDVARAATARDPSARLFDPDVVHDVALTVAPGDIAALRVGDRDRVAARLTVDGVTRKLVGLRLLGGPSARGIDQKAGFSVKVDEFVAGKEIAGVDRFSLANAVRDPSFVSEHLTYEVFRRAGIPAPRTALASVKVNDEPFGLYVLREVYDQEFLDRNFADPDGNLYEAPRGADLADPRLEPRTNEGTATKADIAAVKRVVDTAPDGGYTDALGALVDLPKLYSYWAAEALTAHWDGYLAPTNVPLGSTDPVAMSNPVPGDFYAYHDPTRRRFVILPAGADQAVGAGLGPGAAATPVLTEPKAGARTVARLARQPGTADALRARMARVVERAWDTPALLARADRLAALVRADGLTAVREEWELPDFEAAFAQRRAFVEQRADAVRAELGVLP